MVASVQISESQIENNAIKFVNEHKNDTSEDQQGEHFTVDFLKIFGVDAYEVGTFEKKVYDSKGKYVGRMDYFWEGTLLIEQKSANINEDVDDAMAQALKRYYINLKLKELPKFILGCTFQEFYLKDKTDETEYKFALEDLPKNIGLFGFIVGHQKTEKADPVNQEATNLIGDIYKAIDKDKHSGESISYFLTRIVFCYFADHTGIFHNKGMFVKYIKEHVAKDGSDLGYHLKTLFDIFNLDRTEREQLKIGDKQRKSFPHINGDLFNKSIDFPDFNAEIRGLVIKAGEYDWSKISPAIFGSMFETVMSKDDREHRGAHYTSRNNILKVIQPLFLDGLRNEYEKIKDNDPNTQKRRLADFQKKLASLTFFDPACGSGNFLIVSYEEIRTLENKVIIDLIDDDFDPDREDINGLSKVDVHQFYGIELMPFSASISEVALWIMDHIMNLRLEKKLKPKFTNVRRIPISKKPYIRCGDALEFNWNELLPSNKCNYVFGNPPFGGIREISEKQNKQLAKIVNSTDTGMLDFVTAWFIKSAEYISEKTPFSFVATNSITQGSQVKKLSDILIKKHSLEIFFAYRSFKWDSQSDGIAQVTVVIIGFSKQQYKTKFLFEENDGGLKKTEVKNITPYLTSSKKPITVIERVPKPINELPEILIKGMAITDDNNYVFDEDKRNNYLKTNPGIEPYLKPYVTARGLLHNEKQWVLLVYEIPENELAKMPKIKQLIKNVTKSRKASKKEQTRKLGEFPKTFERPIVPKGNFLIIPVVSSEKRQYIPMGFGTPPEIASAATIIGDGASVGLFSLLITKMHMLWLKQVGGRLKFDLRYSNIVYNTFPTPKDYEKLEEYGQKILDIRTEHSHSSLAILYDLITMPDDLKKAHQKLDLEAEKLYRKEPFKDDQDRLEFLLGEYQKMTEKKQDTLD